MIVLDAVLPELLEGEHTADAHFMEYLLHDVGERGLPQPGLPIHSEAQQLGELKAVLVCHISEGLQDTFISTLKACVGQDCGHCLVKELPAGVPAEFRHRFPLPTERGHMAVLLVLSPRVTCPVSLGVFVISVKPLAQISRGFYAQVTKHSFILLPPGHVSTAHSHL